MKIRRIVSIFVYILVIQAVVLAAGQDKVDLKLRLKAGESHEMKMTTTADMNCTINGQEQKTRQSQEMIISLDCLGVDANGDMDVEVVYKSVTMDGPMGHIVLDSANPKPVISSDNSSQQAAGNMLSSFVRGGINQAVFNNYANTAFGISPGVAFLSGGIAGLVVDAILNPPAPVDAGKTGASVSDPNFDIIGKKYRMKITPAGQTESAGFSLGEFLPAKPVKIGDTWHNSSSIKSVMPMNIGSDCVLKNRKDGIAFIDAVSRMDMGGSSFNSEALGIDPNFAFSMQMSGTTNSTNEVDEKNGLIRKSNMTTNITTVMKKGANSQMPEKMTAPMTTTMTSNTVMELIK